MFIMFMRYGKSYGGIKENVATKHGEELSTIIACLWPGI